MLVVYGLVSITLSVPPSQMTKKFLLLFLLLLRFTAVSMADEIIRVDRVDFNSLRDDWVQVEIELSCTGNPSPEARSPRFVENIKVKVYLAYLRDASTRKFDYYSSEVEILIMEQGDNNNVYFYMPGPIIERDRLKKDPDFFYVEVFVDDKSQKPQQTAMSRNIPDLEILNSFIKNADSGSYENEHLLMPIYLVSGIELGRVSDLPVFLRRDVRK